MLMSARRSSAGPTVRNALPRRGLTTSPPPGRHVGLGCRAPEPNRAVAGCLGQDAAVGGKGHAANPTGVPPEDGLDLPGRRVPEPDRPVVAGGRQGTTLGGIDAPADRIPMPGEHSGRAAIREDPGHGLSLRLTFRLPGTPALRRHDPRAENSSRISSSTCVGSVTVTAIS